MSIFKSTMTPILLLSLCSFVVTVEFTDEFIKSPNFIDKSLLFREIFRERWAEPVFATFPPKFGKTTNLQMLKKLIQFELDFNDQAKPMERTSAFHLLQNLKLGLRNPEIYSKHLAQHPVILFDLKYDIEGAITHEKLVAGLTTKIQQLFKEYEWLGHKLRSHRHGDFFQKALQAGLSSEELLDSLYVLGEMLHGYFNQSQVVLLVDNFDYVSNYDFVNPYVTDPLYAMIHVIILKIAKAPFCHKRSLILSVSDRKVTAPLYGNIRQFPFLEEDAYCAFFGILPSELEQLFDNYWPISREEQTHVKKWYAGYETNLVYRPIYNTYSIIEYFRHRNETNPFRQYWARVQDTKFISRFLQLTMFRTAFNELLQYGTICSKFRKRRLLAEKNFLPSVIDDKTDLRIGVDKVQNLVGLLFEYGYLGHRNYMKDGSYKIPNLEIEILLVDVAIQFYKSYNIPVVELAKDLMTVFNETDNSTESFQAGNFEWNMISITVPMGKAGFITSIELEYFNVIHLATSYIKMTVPGTEVILKWLTTTARDDILLLNNGKAMLINFDQDPKRMLPSDGYMCKCIEDRNITTIKLLALTIFDLSKIKCLIRSVECGPKN